MFEIAELAGKSFRVGERSCEFFYRPKARTFLRIDWRSKRARLSGTLWSCQRLSAG